jgi:hypothetical protein
MNGKQKFESEMKIHAVKRCCINLCGNKSTIDYKYLGGKWPVVEEAVDPTLILWHNLGVGQCSRAIRTALVYLSCLGLVGCAFYLIVYIMNVRDEYNAGMFKASDCGANEFEKDQALADWTLP